MGVGVGIDVGSHTTRVVKVARKGSAITWAGAVATPTAGEDLPAQLKGAAINPRGGVTGLSGKSTIIRYSHLPLAPAWKLKMLVGYEATQGTELDVSFDYRLLNLPASMGSGGLTVLAAVTKNAALTEQLGQLAARGVRGVDFVPDSLALYEVFSRCPEKDIALDQYCLVLDVGASKTEMTIVYNGSLVFARSVGFGGQDFTKAVAAALGVQEDQAERLKVKRGEIISEDDVPKRPSAEQPMLTALAQAAEEFFGAIRASLMFARAQTKLLKMDIGRVFLSGAGARLKGMAEFLAERLDVRASTFAPPDDWNVPGEPGQPSEWMVALGLALLSLESPEERMSILPPTERKRRRFWRHDIFAYAACVVFAVAAAVGVTARVHNWSGAKAAIETRRSLAEKARERDDALAVLDQGNSLRRDRLRLLAAAADSGARLVEFIDLIKRSQQGAVSLSKLVFEPGDINKAGAAPVVTLAGSVGQSETSFHKVLDDFSRQLTTSSQRAVEHASKSAAGDSLEFRLRIPLADRSAGEEPQ